MEAFNILGKKIRSGVCLILAVYLLTACTNKNDFKGYLFVYFTGNGPGEEQVHCAVSDDGLNYRALNNNKPIILSKDISSSGGVRDPHILRSPDGNHFYMVLTDLFVPDMGWNNTAMVMLKSDDLIHWEHSKINIPESYPSEFADVNRVWAPQTIYDKSVDKYMVYFSMKSNNDPDIIYYAYANKNFTGFEAAPKQLFFSPTNNSCIDADIIEKDGKYHMFFKSEDGKPGIKLAISDKVNGGFKQQSSERVDKEVNNVEGSGVFKLNHSDEWILMYDVYMKGRYQFAKTKDLVNFEVIDQDISMNFHPRHGCVLPITQKELEALVSKWGTFEDPLIDINAKEVKSQNIVVDGKNKTIHIPVKKGVDVKRFNPQFYGRMGFSISPNGDQDFSNGSVNYEVKINNKKSEIFKVSVSEDHNPVIEGFYADPDMIYSEKTGKYYLYPTSDGFDSWSGYYFKTFSSDNLIDWKDEGIILDLKNDVSWADRNAWAPTAIEKKVGDSYKYYYYYTAAQKIGVAVSDNPTGPFKDKGEALINEFPKGINKGQQIDPFVFNDPESNKCYLYWGNCYMAGAELEDNMISIKENTLKVITPDDTYREGTCVFYRNGKYYFLWSEDDTRSPNYKVRYALSDSPLGELSKPKNNIVVKKRPEAGIYGTGHNSVIKVPGKDEWYLVYHRFTRPKGIEMGRAAGFHREVCIDKLLFNDKGEIIEVVPTLEGIK